MRKQITWNGKNMLEVCHFLDLGKMTKGENDTLVVVLNNKLHYIKPMSTIAKVDGKFVIGEPNDKKEKSRR